MVSQSLDAGENPATSLSEILRLIHQCDTAIETAQAEISDASQAFDQYEVLAIEQCTPVIQAITQMGEPVQKLYDALKVSAFLPQGRHLTELYHLQRQAEKLKSDMSTFRRQVITAPPQDLIKPRQIIERQLVSFLRQLGTVSGLLIDEAYEMTVHDQDHGQLLSGNTDQAMEARREKEARVKMLRRIQAQFERNRLALIADQAEYIDPRDVPLDSKIALSLTEERIKEVESQLRGLGEVP
jgi:hypothetical protein